VPETNERQPGLSDGPINAHIAVAANTMGQIRLDLVKVESVGPARLGEAERRVRPAGASGDSMFTRKAYATREAPTRGQQWKPANGAFSKTIFYFFGK
jgi:hypothetical protein